MDSNSYRVYRRTCDGTPRFLGFQCRVVMGFHCFNSGRCICYFYSLSLAHRSPRYHHNVLRNLHDPGDDALSVICLGNTNMVGTLLAEFYGSDRNLGAEGNEPRLCGGRCLYHASDGLYPLARCGTIRFCAVFRNTIGLYRRRWFPNFCVDRLHCTQRSQIVQTSY